MNIAEKLLARASSRDEVKPGEIIQAKVDMAMINEITGPLAIKAFNEIGAEKVWDKNRVVMILDHQIPADSQSSAELHKIMRQFAKEQRIPFFYDIGWGGVCHQVMIEKGHVRPGELIVGADSHTCSYGALGAFSTGIGSTEMAAVFTKGEIWLKTPSTIRINSSGSFQEFVFPKDLILHIVGLIGSAGATYKAIEFCGVTVDKMGVSGRVTLCNMAVEMGAKTGLINPDKITTDYVNQRTSRDYKILRSDSDAHFEKTLKINVDSLEPQVACPNSVDNVKPVKKLEGLQIDQGFIGSCTNGRFEDLEVAALILKGRKIHEGVRLLVTPASQEIYLQALKSGLLETFIKSGAYVCNPTCGACFGGHMGVMTSGEVCISSSNRNFVGRMGSPDSKIYLASPATIAVSSINGIITDPRTYIGV